MYEYRGNFQVSRSYPDRRDLPRGASFHRTPPDGGRPHRRAGVVRSELEGIFYRGQIEEDAAQAIFKTPAGENTGIIDTTYGYLIVYVDSFSLVGYADRISYNDQLKKAREEYRTQLMESLIEEQREAEYDRLLQDADIVIHDAVWNRILATVD